MHYVAGLGFESYALNHHILHSGGTLQWITSFPVMVLICLNCPVIFPPGVCLTYLRTTEFHIVPATQ